MQDQHLEETGVQVPVVHMGPWPQASGLLVVCIGIGNSDRCSNLEPLCSSICISLETNDLASDWRPLRCEKLSCRAFLS